MYKALHSQAVKTIDVKKYESARRVDYRDGSEVPTRTYTYLAVNNTIKRSKDTLVRRYTYTLDTRVRVVGLVLQRDVLTVRKVDSDAMQIRHTTRTRCTWFWRAVTYAERLTLFCYRAIRQRTDIVVNVCTDCSYRVLLKVEPKVPDESVEVILCLRGLLTKQRHRAVNLNHVCFVMSCEPLTCDLYSYIRLTDR